MASNDLAVWSLAPTPQQNLAAATAAATTAATAPASTAVPAPVNYTVFGDTIPQLFGKTKVLGAPLWAGPVKTNSDGTRALDAAFVFGKRDPRAIGASVQQIYIDETLVYDTTASPPLATPFDFTLYEGSEEQTPDPTIVAQEGANRTPGFRGLIYIVMRNYTVPAGANFPQMTATIVQKLSNDGQRDVTPFATGDTQSRNNLKVDYSSGLMYSTRAGAIDIYSTTTKSLWQSVPVTGIAFNTSMAVAISNVDGGVYAQSGSLANHETLYLIDKSTGAVTTQFGAENGSLGNGSTAIEFMNDLVCANALTDNADEVILGGAITSHVVALFRLANVITFYNVWDTGAGLGKFQQIEPVDLSNSTMPNFDYKKFCMAWVTAENHTLFQLIIIPPGSDGAIGTRRIAYSQDDGVMSGANAGLPAYLFSGTQTLIGVEGMVEITGALSATETIVFMMVDPAEARWLAALVSDSATGKTYYRRWNTVYSQLGTFSPGNTAGVANPAPPLPAVDYMSLADNFEITQALPAIGVADYANLRMRPKGQTKISLATGATLVVLDMMSGDVETFSANTFINSSTQAAYPGTAAFSGLLSYDDTLKAVYYLDIGTNNDKPGMAFLDETASGDGSLLLSDFCKSLGVLADFDISDIVTSGIDDEVTGAIIDTQVKFLDIVNRVATLFRFDVLESQGKLKFQRKPRGSGFAVDRTLRQADLAPINQSGADDGTLLTKARDATSALPGQLQAIYLDSDNSFQIGSQTAKRTQFPLKTSAGTNAMTCDVPVAMTAGQALYWATFCLFDMWAGALTFGVLTSAANAGIEVGDYIEVQLDDGSEFLTKCVSKTLNGDFSVSLELSTILATAPDMQHVPAARVELAALVATGSSAVDNTASTDPSKSAVNTGTGTLTSDFIDYSVASSDTAGSTVYSTTTKPTAFIVDNVLPFEADDAVSFVAYFMASNPADIYRFASNVYGFAAHDIVAPGCGVTTNSLPTFDRFGYPDEASVIIYRPLRGVPITCTDDDFIAGKNTALVGGAGRWEMIYFRDVTNNGDGTLSLSHLLRGRRGSDGVMSLHRTGDVVILLAAGEYGVMTFAASDFNSSAQFRMLPAGAAITDSSAQSFDFTLSAGTKKPWAPVHLAATRSGSDVILSWTRRDRIDSDLHDGDDTTPMSETSEQYSVDIYRAGAIVRTANAISSPSYTYLAADQTTDGFSSPIEIEFSVYQVSALIGRGYKGNASCPII